MLKTNWELSMWFPEEQIHKKSDIRTKADIGKDKIIWYLNSSFIH